MAECKLHYTALVYDDYGCWCGIGGSGTPIDGIDMCCKLHDQCYDLAVDRGLCYDTYVEYADPYSWTCQQGEPNCSQKQFGCKAALCECDKNVVNCWSKFKVPSKREKCTKVNRTYETSGNIGGLMGDERTSNFIDRGEAKQTNEIFGNRTDGALRFVWDVILLKATANAMPFFRPFHFPRLHLRLLLLLPFVLVVVLSDVPSSSPSSSPQFAPSVAFHRSGDRFFVPRQIPKMSRTKKRKLLLEKYKSEGIEPPREFYETDWAKGRKRKRTDGRQKRHRATAQADNRARRVVQHVVRRQHKPRTNGRLQARNAGQCPSKLDAVTEAFNRHLYLFSAGMVYEVWRDSQGLQQKRAFALSELFPNGPRRVNAAFTNRKSGVTVLLDYRTVYRFRWDKRYKRFYMARHSPRQLPSQIDFLPKKGFQWRDGHLILSNTKKFVSFDPFWNMVTFSSDKANEYFPNLDKRMVGVAKHGKDAYLMITEEGKLQVYDMDKHKVRLEFPVSLRHLLACLTVPNSTTLPN
ncbi:hypothetical protein niasHT_037050 [Heterodera trifolii]|uniref:Phospholipase A2-like central domain-containing protein n=1 Tax=Heterodera trifolii TaxID=157864 RepID=A0ABD2IUN4_9BILA